MAGIGKARVKRPEHLDDAHGRLRDRLGNVAARRRDSADGGDGAAAVSVAADAADAAGALVELRNARREVGRVAFFAGHLLQTAGHLTQRLGPAGGGVSQNGDVIAHVAEILRDGDAGVDGRLTRSHRHIGGVGDEHGALHERLAVARVGQLRELHENVGHLVAAFAAADVDDDVHVRPLGELVLHDGLAAAERAGHGRRAALGDREERVDDTLAAVHGLVRSKLLRIGARDTHRPALDHVQLMIDAGGIGEHGDGLVDREVTAGDALDRARHLRGHHDLVQDGRRLLDGADHVAAGNGGAGLHNGIKVPHALAVERGHLDAAGDVRAGQVADLGQRALDTVIDILQHTGAKLHGQRHTGRLDFRAGAETGGLLVDLDGRAVTGHIQDLADQALLADTHNVGDVGIGKTVGHDQRTGNFCDSSAQFHSSFP